MIGRECPPALVRGKERERERERERECVRGSKVYLFIRNHVLYFNVGKYSLKTPNGSKLLGEKEEQKITNENKFKYY